MMMGPEPMIIIFLMSVRRGTALDSPRLRKNAVEPTQFSDLESCRRRTFRREPWGWTAPSKIAQDYHAICHFAKGPWFEGHPQPIRPKANRREKAAR